MSWKYEQASGRLSDMDGSVVGIGYSGRYPDGKNKPEAQSIESVGPIPTGSYFIQPPVNTVTHGPFVLPLSPFSQNTMFGRSGFLMHGDSVVHPGTASEGCIIMPRDVREKVWQSGDHTLQVVSGITTYPDVDGEIAT